MPDNRWLNFLERARFGGSVRARESLARILQSEFGELNEIIGGDELYPSETTWYFTAPKRS